MRSRTYLVCLIMLALLGSPVAASGQDLLIRPEPQIMQPSDGGFAVTAETRIAIPEGWPACVKVSAQELAQAINASGGPKPAVVETAASEFKKGDIIVAPYEWLGRYLWFIEPMPQAIVRPAPREGYNIRITPENLVLAGNSGTRLLHGAPDAHPDRPANRGQGRQLSHARPARLGLARPRLADAAASVRRVRVRLRSRRAPLQSDHQRGPARALDPARRLQQAHRALRRGGNGHGVRAPSGGLRRGLRHEQQRGRPRRR